MIPGTGRDWGRLRAAGTGFPQTAALLQPPSCGGPPPPPIPSDFLPPSNGLLQYDSYYNVVMHLIAFEHEDVHVTDRLDVVVQRVLRFLLLSPCGFYDILFLDRHVCEPCNPRSKGPRPRNLLLLGIQGRSRRSWTSPRMTPSMA